MSELQVRQSDVCGILSVCLFATLPLPALILGVVALARREKTVTYGVVGLVLSLIVTIVWVLGLRTTIAGVMA